MRNWGSGGLGGGAGGKTNFFGNGVPKENMHYTCIACITIDSVMRIDKKQSAGLFTGIQI